MSVIATARALAALVFVSALAALAPAGASAETTTVGLHGWQVQSSAQVGLRGAQISQPGYSTAGWLAVTPDDAGAVGTEVNALVENGRCPNVFFSTNMKSCFGYMDQIGPEKVPEFAVPWWFRTTFLASPRSDERTDLIINGVVGTADVWVNGTRVAGDDAVQGDYTRFVFDISPLLRAGENALALEVHPNDPNTMFTLDNVDWTEIPPDNNTGIQFPIQLHTAGPLALSDAHVNEANAPDLSSSQLTLKGTITNVTSSAQSGTLTATVSAPGGGRTWTLEQPVTVPAGSTRTIALPLRVEHPQVWWPYQLGAQPLYGFTMTVQSAGGSRDSESETFGIRTITTRLIGPAPIAPDGSRQFLVNGVPIVFRAGGWSENLFLHYSAANTAEQIAVMKNLGINGIRTEGKQMPADFYEQMDRAGILIDGGYQCCDAWQLEDTHLGTPHNYELLYNSAKTIGQNLRNHPSVMNFSWSDDQPTPEQEKVSLEGFSQADFQDPLIASAEYKTAPGLGPSGEKEGPYDWVPPSYWYSYHYERSDPTRTNVGGAWAFDSEVSAGATVPTLDSIERWLSPFEQTELWTNPDYNQYHLNYEKGLPNPQVNYGYAFGTLHDLDAAIKARYGPWSSLEGYVEEAQLQNYEDTRAQFEAYIAHSINPQAPSTGVVYWQLNKGWPTLLWDIYNYDFDMAGSYFGAKKANETLHAIYTYDTGTVTVDNLGASAQDGLTVEARVYDTAGDLLSDQRSRAISLPSQGVAGDVLKPVVPAATEPPQKASTYFVELLLRRHDTIVDRNAYWLSTQPDLVNWSATNGLPQATMNQYADLTALHTLAGAKLSVTATEHAAPGPDGADRVAEVTITNTSDNRAVALFIRADLRRGNAAGVPASGDNELLPVFWSDNDTTLWPGESETLRVQYRSAQLNGASPVLTVSAWNVPTMDVPVG